MYLIRKRLAAKYDWCALGLSLSVDRVSVWAWITLRA